MIPCKTDPRWRHFVLSNKDFEFETLVTQLMHSRIKLIIKSDPSDASINAAISLAYDFFEKNHKLVLTDMKVALGEPNDKNA